jgi:hypothetical protein
MFVGVDLGVAKSLKQIFEIYLMFGDVIVKRPDAPLLPKVLDLPLV